LGASIAAKNLRRQDHVVTFPPQSRKTRDNSTMRKIKILAHISLDGMISPAARHEGDDEYVNGGWTAPYRSGTERAVVEAQGSGFDLLLGRRTYDIFAGYWPTAASSPIADGLNAATKYVATHRTDSLTWGPVGDLGADILEGIRSIKSRSGGDLIVWGSSTLTSLMLEQGLVDDVVLLVCPVLLGKGKRFFSESADPRELALVSNKAVSSGVLVNTYRYVGSPRTE
jgi:dihydrofolate reductase